MAARETRKSKVGLVLTGGGARAAYQAGVLKAIGELLPARGHIPFQILCGCSAGAINAAMLAVFADDFGLGVKNLLDAWKNFRAHQFYRAEPLRVVASSLTQWLAAMMRRASPRPLSLLNNAPLAETLSRMLDLGRIQENIDAGALYAVSVNCFGYTSGQSVSFYQGGPGVEAWESVQRQGCATALRIDHLMASSALPFIFPAVKINREYFGEGSLGQAAPISPALHLGADRIFIIGSGRRTRPPARARSSVYPSPAQIAGHALNHIFVDGVNVEIEAIERLNRTISLIPPERLKEAGSPLRKIDVLVMSPSRSIERLVPRFTGELPAVMRGVLRGIGAMNRNGASLASYLLFERGFCSALIDLGYRDTMEARAEILEFLGAGR
jgi:NTE family protein